MADKQYYVKVTFAFGVDGGDGNFDVKNDGEATWYSMDYNDAVAFQNFAVIPQLNMMNTKAGEAGMIKTGQLVPEGNTKSNR